MKVNSTLGVDFVKLNNTFCGDCEKFRDYKSLYTYEVLLVKAKLTFLLAYKNIPIKLRRYLD